MTVPGGGVSWRRPFWLVSGGRGCAGVGARIACLRTPGRSVIAVVITLAGTGLLME